MVQNHDAESKPHYCIMLIALYRFFGQDLVESYFLYDLPFSFLSRVDIQICCLRSTYTVYLQEHIFLNVIFAQSPALACSSRSRHLARYLASNSLLATASSRASSTLHRARLTAKRYGRMVFRRSLIS
jgi:hypothetical protein